MQAMARKASDGRGSAGKALAQIRAMRAFSKFKWRNRQPTMGERVLEEDFDVDEGGASTHGS